MKTFRSVLTLSFWLLVAVGLTVATPAMAFDPVEYTVCLKAHNGKFVFNAKDKKSVFATSSQCNELETITLIDLTGNQLFTNDTVAIKTHWGRYWSAQKNGKLEANRTYNKEWETFRIRQIGKWDNWLGGDNIDFNKPIALHNNTHARYVAVELGSGMKSVAPLVANRGDWKEWETFNIELPQFLKDLNAAPKYKYCLMTNNGTNFITSSDDKKTVDAKGTKCEAGGVHTVFDLNGGFLMHGDKVVVKTNWGRYWTAHKDGNLTGHVDYVREWEKFTIQKAGLDKKTKPVNAVDKRRLFSISFGDHIGFLGHHGKWVQAVDRGGKAMNVTGKELLPWETFTAFNPACAPSCDDQLAACMKQVMLNMAWNSRPQQYFLEGKFACEAARNTCKKVCRQ